MYEYSNHVGHGTSGVEFRGPDGDFADANQIAEG